MLAFTWLRVKPVFDFNRKKKDAVRSRFSAFAYENRTAELILSLLADRHNDKVRFVHDTVVSLTKLP